MKLTLRLLLSALLILYTVQLDVAQTIVQQSVTHADAGLNYSAQEGLGTAAQTLTLTPNGGEFVYIFEIDITNVQGAAAVTATTTSTITTTNINGAPLWVMASGGSTPGAGGTTQQMQMKFPNGLRAAAPTTAVTFVLPVLKINQGLHVNVAWRSAP